MAGSIAANTNNGAGVASVGYNAKMRLYNIASANSGMFINSNQAINGVNFAVQDGVDVLNLSFTFPSTGAMRTTIDNAIASGVTVVTAAGNNGYNSGCDIPGIICVTSVTLTDEHGPTKNKSSSAVDLTAPDRGYTSLGKNGGLQMLGRGTSFSSGIVSGALALMHQVYPNMTPATARQILRSTADDISGIGNNGTTYAGKLGTGRLNVYAAVQEAQIKASSMSGAQSLCTNSTYTYSVPSFAGATYTWQVFGATLVSGQGTRSVQVSTNSNFYGGRVECVISVGTTSELKALTVSRSYGCAGGPYYLKAFPNPTSGILLAEVAKNIEVPETLELNLDVPVARSFILYDYAGRLVRSVLSDQQARIDTDGLAKGFYFLQVTTDSETFTERVEVW